MTSTCHAGQSKSNSESISCSHRLCCVLARYPQEPGREQDTQAWCLHEVECAADSISDIFKASEKVKGEKTETRWPWTWSLSEGGEPQEPPSFSRESSEPWGCARAGGEFLTRTLPLRDPPSVFDGGAGVKEWEDVMFLSCQYQCDYSPCFCLQGPQFWNSGWCHLLPELSLWKINYCISRVKVLSRWQAGEPMFALGPGI